MRLVAGDILSVKADAALVRPIDAGDDVEQGRFAGTVGPDDRDDAAAGDLERQVVHGGNAAKVDAEPVDLEQAHDDLQPKRPAIEGKMPWGRKIMISIIVRPSTTCS